MSEPYVSSRAGSTQWLMQRVSAVLLIAMAFGHFALQHFTSDAVSTGLTVAARLNNPWWQAYYVVFVILALYHGINGVVGIVRDYDPPRAWRLAAEVTLWLLAAWFGARGIVNIATPPSLASVKERYAAQGFPAGETMGNPPNPLAPKIYDFAAELRELHLLAHYLGKYVHRTEAQPLTVAAVFGTAAGGQATPAAVTAAGESLDRWLLTRIGDPAGAAVDHAQVFSSTREFALWAAGVRRADARARARAAEQAGDVPARDAARAVLERLQSVPAYASTVTP